MDEETIEFIQSEKTSLQNKWRSAHHKIMIVLSVSVFLCELVMFFCIPYTGFLINSISDYLRKYVIVPAVTYFILNVVVSVLLRQKIFSCTVKNYIMSIGFAVFFISVFFMHDFFLAVFA